MKRGPTTIFEITDTHVKMLQARAVRNTRVVTNVKVQPIHEQSDKEIVKILSTMISAKEIRAGEVVGVVPRRFAILKNISLPSHSDDEIDKMISLQIVNHIPYQREDIVFDYMITEKDPSGYTKALAIILHKDVVNRYLKIFNGAGIHPNNLTISSVGLLHWLKYQDNKTKADRKKTALLINFDETSSEICFCGQDKLLFSRNINFGARDINKEKEENFLKQLYMTLGTYKREKMGPDINRIILVSTIAEITLIKERLLQNFNYPIESFTPIDNMPCRKELDVASVWGGTGLSLTPSFGMLFPDGEKSINLLPSELEFTKQSRLKKQQWIRAGALTLITIFLAVFAYGVDIYQDTEYLKDIKSQADRLAPVVKEAKKKSQLLGFIKDEFENRVLIVELFSELYDITPEGIAFRSFIYDEKGWVTIHGYSKIAANVNAFQSQLVNSSMFQDVNLQYATKLRIFNEELTDFKLTCKTGNRKEKR